MHPPEIEGATVDLQGLQVRIQALEDRVQALEQGGRATSTAAQLSEQVRPEPAESTAAETAALAGRMALGLGGAFVFRSATQAGVLHPWLGVVLGLAYGLAWLAAADRAAFHGRVRHAVADAVMAALIGFPLVWEATARFRFLTQFQAWVAVAVISSGYLLVASRRRMPGLLWPVVVGMPPLCFALSLTTGTFPPWLGLLLASATVLQWTAARHGHFPPVATTALVLFHVSLALVTAMVCIATPLVLERALAPEQVLAIQTAAFVLGSAALLLRAARSGRVHRREAGQAAVATLIGLGGALAVGHRTGTSMFAAGVAAVVLGLAACILAARIPRPAVLGVPGLAVAVVGCGTLLSGTPFQVALSILAAAAALAALTRRDGPLGAWLGVQAAIAGGLLLALSGALFFAVRALVGGEVGLAPAPVALALTAGVACAAVLPAAADGERAVSRRLLLFGLLLVAAGLVATVLSPACPPLLRPVLRTLVIAVGAVSMARVAPALVYPLLIAGGVKIVVDDFRAGEPVVLVLSFSLYGAALLLAPRVLRRARLA